MLDTIKRNGAAAFAGGFGGYILAKRAVNKTAKKLQILRNRQMHLAVQEMELPRQNEKMEAIVNELNEAKNVVEATSLSTKLNLEKAISLF